VTVTTYKMIKDRSKGSNRRLEINYSGRVQWIDLVVKLVAGMEWNGMALQWADLALQTTKTRDKTTTFIYVSLQV
jgi:hypothetical protein